MANEFNVPASANSTIYVLLFNRSGLVWNLINGAFETYTTASRANYSIPLTEQGTASGLYMGNFPSNITASGLYTYFAYRQRPTNTTPAENDAPALASGEIDWTGASLAGGSGGMSATVWRDYVLRSGFRRTDKDAELYDATTDAIHEMRRRFVFDEARTETTTTDMIISLGDFKLNLESDFGIISGLVMEDGDDAMTLTKIPKEIFDELYPDINITTDRGYPEHFCIYGGSIYLGPVPDRTSYVYRVSYSRGGLTISASTTSVPFTNDYRDVLLSLVLSSLYKGLDDFEKANYFRQEFENKFLDCTRRESINSGGSARIMRARDF